MSLTHLFVYNKILGNAQNEVQTKLQGRIDPNTQESIEACISVYAEAYAEIYCSLSFSDIARYKHGSKQEIYNWAKARELFETAYPGGTLADFMSQDFQKMEAHLFLLKVIKLI